MMENGVRPKASLVIRMYVTLVYANVDLFPSADHRRIWHARAAARSKRKIRFSISRLCLDQQPNLCYTIFQP